jgi:flavin reductase (DIM6/NTAB) family NADH-FMN oxidoreductase RutF
LDIAASQLDADAAYKLLVGIVVPRPIAWITTMSRSGIVNAAPFSCYTFVCNDPPMLAINIGRRDGDLKDTARNIVETGEFVVNIVTEGLIASMHATSTECAPDLSEVEALQLATHASRDIRPPRLSASPINLECRLDQVLELGRLRNSLILGEIVRFHISDDLYDKDKVDSVQLRPLARLAGRKYAMLGEVLLMPKAEIPGHPADSR